MNESVLTWGKARRPKRMPVTGYSEPADDVLTELAADVFSPLRRRDQRLKAEQYLHGLLHARGRKSMRNIAATLAGPAAEQGLQHFISNSTWDWQLVRARLARHLDRVSPPEAWVVQPLHIPKAGNQSAGVETRYVPEYGQVMSGQQAFGVWFADREGSTPVNWRLYLPPSWVGDPVRRSRTEIPEEVAEEHPEACAVAAVTGLRGWGLGTRPVLLDARLPELRPVLGRLRAEHMPVLARTTGSARFEVADPAVPGYGAGPVAAQRIVEAVRGLRRPVAWTDPAGGWGTRTSLYVQVRVRFPQGGEAVLLGEWRDPHRPPVQLWVSTLADTPGEELVRLSKLSRRVARDTAEEGSRVGLRDFEGRSFPGWHRHMTLASVALAAGTLGAARRHFGPLPARLTA
ncbi:IS701 family transposase [Kitasatospora sp. NPDC051853]|uniref:IS701 family transposase n=1 Tax=Kitasatospora sp. NPDC051853 TaxID=3364058 RepID=UPI0037956BBD